MKSSKTGSQPPSISEHVLQTVLTHVDAHIYMKSGDGRFLYVNQKMLDLYGLSSNEMLGRTDLDLLPEGIARKLMQMDRRVLKSNTRHAKEETVPDSEGRLHHFWSIKVPINLPGQPPALIGFSTDITEMLELKRSLELQQTTDSVTGLLNRAQFERELNSAMRVASQHKLMLAVIVLDLDRFKYINNTHGREVGNLVLQEVAQRLCDCSWLQDDVARLSGNQFAVMMRLATNTEDVANLVEQLRELLAQPYRMAGQTFYMTVSAGVSFYPDHAQQAQEIIGFAESAMHHAKEQGRNQFQYFSTALRESLSEQLTLEGDLRQALEQEEFVLHYQPKMCADGARVHGVEALVRWQKPSGELVPPGLFIPLAEQLGLIVPLGNWVINEACRQLAEWHKAGLKDISVAVNLSTGQLGDPGLIAQVAYSLASHRLPPTALELEVTESMMMTNTKQAIEKLKTLQVLGVKLSIDDFGTGYSSLSYFKQIPADTLKLDRSFIQQIEHDGRDLDLCAGIIALSHQLGLSVVAEGVETQAQWALLSKHGCDLFQGYLFSKPLPADDAFRFLTQANATSE